MVPCTWDTCWSKCRPIFGYDSKNLAAITASMCARMTPTAPRLCSQPKSWVLRPSSKLRICRRHTRQIQPDSALALTIFTPPTPTKTGPGAKPFINVWRPTATSPSEKSVRLSTPRNSCFWQTVSLRAPVRAAKQKINTATTVSPAEPPIVLLISSTRYPPFPAPLR